MSASNMTESEEPLSLLRGSSKEKANKAAFPPKTPLAIHSRSLLRVILAFSQKIGEATIFQPKEGYSIRFIEKDCRLPKATGL